MRKAASRILAVALLLAAAAAGAGAAVDAFGVSELYPAASGGRQWVSKWNNGVARSFTGVDPQDAWFDAAHGSANYYADGQGLFYITGSTPRMYVHDPAKVQEWHDVEMTVYAMRVADDGTAYAGIVGVARSNHGTTGPELSNLCDTRGYGARVRYDGNVDFDKETSHPNATAIATKPLFAGGMPKNKWIGYKHVVYDMPNGHVMNELWVDLTDGAGGGSWQKVDSFEDTGGNFAVGAVACKSGINPALMLTNSDARPGSESGKPNITVYWRSTNVGTRGLVYKKMSVREITPPGGTTTTTTGGTTTGGATTGGTTTGGTTTTTSPAGAPVLSNVLATNVTQTGATITWSTDKVSHSQVEYGVTTSYGTLTYQSSATGTGHSMTLSNLQPGTVFHYRAMSKDDATGLTGYSADLTFTTTGTSSTSGTSGGTTSGTTLTTSVSHSQVEYGTSTSYGAQTYQSSAAGQYHSMALSGLKRKTTYHYRVKSLDSATGKTAVSGDYIFKTL